jgi:hypothetical protein
MSLQIFVAPALPSAVFQPPPRRIPPPPRRVRSRCARRFASGYVAAWLKAHSWRSSGPDRENFEPSRYSGFWKHISIIFRKEAAFDRHCERGEAIHGPAAARSPNSPRKQPEDVQTAYPFRPRPRTTEAPFSACSEVEPEASAVTGRSSNSAQDLKSSLVIRCCLSQRDEE